MSNLECNNNAIYLGKIIYIPALNTNIFDNTPKKAKIIEIITNSQALLIKIGVRVDKNKNILYNWDYLKKIQNKLKKEVETSKLMYN